MTATHLKHSGTEMTLNKLGIELTPNKLGTEITQNKILIETLMVLFLALYSISLPYLMPNKLEQDNHLNRNL